MTTTIKADGVPTPKQIKEPFVVKVECFWRDHANNYEPRSVMRTFKGKDKADVYQYIKYYSLAFGLYEMVHKGEGWGEPTDEPDMTDPTVLENIVDADPILDTIDLG